METFLEKYPQHRPSLAGAEFWDGDFVGCFDFGDGKKPDLPKFR